MPAERARSQSSRVLESSDGECYGKFYVVLENHSDVKGYKISNPDGTNWNFPFDAVSLAAY